MAKGTRKSRVLGNPYGIRMYGKWFGFDSKTDAENFCIDGMAECEGSERERYVKALVWFREGWNYVNTDSP